MGTVVVTGSGGLVGSACARHFTDLGYEVIGIDNDMRARFFGPEASTEWNSGRLEDERDAFRCERLDIRDRERIEQLFAGNAARIELIVHAAAQPSHDWAASDPHADFTINANGTLNLLQAARENCPDATFAFISTSKVYGDRPNFLPLIEGQTRLDLAPDHPFHHGIDTTMPIDGCLHSLFGVSKAAADLAVQEYGRYFQMPTVCFRGGCLSGPQHSGAQLHGFLAYLMMRTVVGKPYTVIGYDGKQVRDNLHALDVARAVESFHRAPRPGAVYNLGGGRGNSVSILEAVELCERIAGRPLEQRYEKAARTGDHRWWISSNAEFIADYPDWEVRIGIEQILEQICAHSGERWLASS